MANSPRHAERDDTEQATRTTRAMADAGERAARAGAETMQHNVDSMTDAWRSGSATASRIAERSMDQVSKMFGFGGDSARQAVQQSAGNIQALMESSSIMAGSFQQLSSEWMRFAQRRVEQNLDHFDQLIGCRSMHDYFALQTQIVRDNAEALLQSARRSSECSTKAADEAMRKISQASLAPH
jgi:hypothetical protein